MFTTERPWLKVYEGHTNPELTFFEGSLYDLFRNSVEEHREKVALSFYGTEIGFPQLHAMVAKMAASLAAVGVRKGDRVALMLPNCPQYVVSFFATVKLGAIVTQLNPMYVEREIKYILKDSRAETIVVYADMYLRVKNVLPETSLKNVVVVGFGEEPEGLDEGHLTFDSFLGMEADPAPEVEINPVEDVAALQYTGGTTGVSKGAMLTHRNLAANVQQTIEVFVENEDDFANNEGAVAVLPYGVPIPSTDAKIVDVETGENEVSVGEPGELIISGPQVIKGYWNMPEETAKTLRGGWLHTGDVATMDEDGYFYIVDRKKDMIVASGYNVYPREIEEILFEHPAVSEAVAIGISDEYRGEAIKAFVVKNQDNNVTEEEILSFCKERLAPYKTPKSIEFRDELPKSTAGKLLRRVLADEEREKMGTGAAEPPSPS